MDAAASKRRQVFELETNLGSVGVVDKGLAVGQSITFLSEGFHLGFGAVGEGDRYPAIRCDTEDLSRYRFQSAILAKQMLASLQCLFPGHRPDDLFVVVALGQDPARSANPMNAVSA